MGAVEEGNEAESAAGLEAMAEMLENGNLTDEELGELAELLDSM